MKKYAQIIDEKTSTVAIGLGDNADLYESIGFSLMDVEQGYDGLWYLSGKSPQQSQEELEAELVQQIKSERADILEELKVEVDGMVFDADIDSQNRIGSKVVAYQNMGMSMDTKVKWVLADNTIADVTLTQLAEAHYRASQVTERIWLEPYNK